MPLVQEETRGFKTDLDWTIINAKKLPSAAECAPAKPAINAPGRGLY